MFHVKRSEDCIGVAKLGEAERLRLEAGMALGNPSPQWFTVVLMRVGLDLHGIIEGPVPQPWACIHLFPGYMLRADEPLEVHITPAFPGQSYHLELPQDA